jgi:hypothetical protein
LTSQTRNIIELGMIYAAIVIIIGYLLRNFLILFWPALTIIAIFFASFILSSLTELMSSQNRNQPRPSDVPTDELARLEGSIQLAITTQSSQSNLSERLRNTVLSLVSLRTGLPKEDLRRVADEQPESLQKTVKDNEILALLGRNLKLSSLHEIDSLLSKIESL